jgi:hypothetical protein
VELSPLYVIAVVETTNSPNYNNLLNKSMSVRITHHWGITHLKELPKANNPQAKTIEYFPLILNKRPVPSVAKTFEVDYQKAHKDGGKATAEQLLGLAEQALSHGLLTDFTRVMDELVAADKDSAVSRAYQQVQADLAQPAAPNPDVAAWKTKLGIEVYRPLDNEQGHYTLLHSGPDLEAKARLARLESTCRSFYYWYALHGKALPVPHERLLAIVVGQPDELFPRTHQIFGAMPLVADGFYARRDNLVIFSGDPRDDSYKELKTAVTAGEAKSGGDTSGLLKGRGDESLQTAMLMLKALEQDAEVAAVTQEGSRQMLASSGLLPRHVEVPDWVEFGTGSFFGTAQASPWPSLGGACSSLLDQNNYLATYKVWSKSKNKLLDEPKLALERVVTDFYFRQAKGSKDKVLMHRARTLSWALTFYLARQKLDGLLRYYEELSKLPRDLEFDDKVLLACFARAFELVEVKKPDTIDAAKFGKFARDWNENINLTTLEPAVNESLEELRKAAQNKPKVGGNPANPGGGGNKGPIQ